MDNKTTSEAVCLSEGVFPFCVKAKRLDLCVFDKLVVRLLQLMHRSQKSFLPRFLYDLPVGHDTLLNAPLYQTWSFQDNANDDKFHHPALCALPLISLIQECGEGSALSAEGHVVWLNDTEAAAFTPLFRHKLAGSSPVKLFKEINGQCNIVIMKSVEKKKSRFSLVSCVKGTLQDRTDSKMLVQAFFFTLSWRQEFKYLHHE